MKNCFLVALALILLVQVCACVWVAGLIFLKVEFGIEPASPWGQEYQLPTPVAQNQPPVQIQPTAIPTPVVRDRVLLFQGTSQTGYSKLITAASSAGIEITPVTDRAEFITELYAPDTALVIYLADSGGDSREDLQSIKRFVDGGGRVLFLYDKRWSAWSETFEDLFGVSIGTEELVNASGVYELHTVLPSFLGEFNTFTKGSWWIIGGGYLETELEGEKRYLVNRMNGAERMVYYQATDLSVTFILAIRANEPLSAVFFDDTAIGHGDNQAAIIRLLEHLLD